MMTELESLIAQECKKAHKERIFAFKSPTIFNGAEIKIKPIDTATYYHLVSLCKAGDALNEERLTAEVLAACLVDPCVMRGEFMDAVGANDALSMVRKLFPMPGQVRILRQKIEEISGFYDGDEVEFREC